MKRPEDICEKMNQVVTFMADIAEDFGSKYYLEQLKAVMEQVGIENDYLREIFGLLASKGVRCEDWNGYYDPDDEFDEYEYEAGEDLKLLSKEVDEIPRLTSEEELELAQKMARGDETAREMLIKGNLHLAVRIAKRYSAINVPLQDIIHEGIIGIIHASHCYDYQKNVPFGTYAIFWIRDNISRHFYSQILEQRNETMRKAIVKYSEIYSKRNPELDTFNLYRFRLAHEEAYSTALAEIKNGRKLSHWMWYFFPQLKGLGRSVMSEAYGMQSLEEARAFLADEYLGAHLIEISNALLQIDGANAAAIMGRPDDMKLRSSMTLFHLAAPEEAVFKQVLEKYFEGELDERTVKMLADSEAE